MKAQPFRIYISSMYDNRTKRLRLLHNLCTHTFPAAAFIQRRPAGFCDVLFPTSLDELPLYIALEPLPCCWL